VRVRDVIPAVGALSLVPVTLAQLGIPTDVFWDARTPALLAAVAVSAAASASGLGGAILVERNAPAISRFDDEVHFRLTSLVASIAAGAGVSHEECSAHGFFIKGTRRKARLVNAGRVRTRSSPSMNAPQWRVGKGVIGRSAATGDYVQVRWGTLSSSAIQQGRQRWKGLSSSDRWGLNWGELHHTHDYELICAAPIFDRGGKLIGVVSFDGPEHLHVRAGYLRDDLRSAARSLSDLWPPPKGWWISHA
jgi:hypothetical protein